MHTGILLKIIGDNYTSKLSSSLMRIRAGFGNILSESRNYSARAYYQRLGQQPLVYNNLGQQVQRAAEKYGKRLAIISCHEDKQLTFEEVEREAQILALKLQELGLKRGEHLGLWAVNTTQWYISYLAAAIGGFPSVCINPALQAREIEYALKKAKVNTLITMDAYGKQNFYAILKEVLPHHQHQSETIEAANLPELKRVVMKFEEAKPEFVNYDQLVGTPTRPQDLENLKHALGEISPESTCNIQFTSGTTGQPKAALLSHFNCVNQSHYFGIYITVHERHKRICFTVPFFHVFGLSTMMTALDYGATLVLPSATFDGVAALETIEREQCNLILGTPTMYVDMLEKQSKMKKCMDSLESGLVGGAACSPEVFSQSKSVLGLKELRIGYGLSESTAAIFSHDGTEPMENAVNSVGRLYEHGEAKVINDQGETVAFGEPGELCVRGYFTMSGYMDDEAKTREALYKDGWLKTGDVFILESSGIGRIVGRKKDVIIRGGENVFPKEIEDFLDTNEHILEAQIIGIPDDRMGEEICAYMRLKPGVDNFSLKDVQLFCKGKIAHYKIPRYLRIVQDFPKTTSGKIQKFKLREMFQQEK